MEPNLRYLAALRLSSDSDESTAIERQRRSIQHHLAAPHVSGVLAGEAEDADVSGGLSPFKRPALGKWLTKRADEFDVLIAYKLDRLTRRALHFNELLKWCQENGKSIVCVEEGFDLSTGPGKMMAQITAVFAEAEWDTIQARVLNGVQTRLENKSWLVGAPPAGYRIKTVEGERRKILEIDPDYHDIMTEMFARILEGQSTHKIAKDYNQRGILTWSDYLRQKKGQEPKGVQWQSTIINKVIRSTWIPGIFTYKGEAVLNDDGEPFILPETPLADVDTWSQMVEKIKPKGVHNGGGNTRVAKSLLSGIALCGSCESPLARVKTSGTKLKDGTRKEGEYFYRCSNKYRGGSCSSGAYIKTGELDARMEYAILKTVGSWEMYERLDSGPSRVKELDAVKTRLSKLEADYMEGKYDGEGQEESYHRMHGAMSAKVKHLETQEKERNNPTLKATGRKYKEVWESKDQEDRREFLRDYGIKMWVFRNAVPHNPKGDRDGSVVDLGDVQRIAQELGLHGADKDLASFRVTANIPKHWMDPNILNNPEEVDEIISFFGEVSEVPEVLKPSKD